VLAGRLIQSSRPPVAFRLCAGGAMMVALLLTGCAKPAAPPMAEAPAPAPPHRGPPPAAICTVTPFTVKTGGSADVAMTVSHEGGYCATALTSDGGQPYDAGLVPVPALHGIPLVTHYNGRTSVEYAPQPGYVGHDNFIVKLIVRGRSGYTTLNVSVTVQ
jgi:hypothetical protein